MRGTAALFAAAWMATTLAGCGGEGVGGGASWGGTVDTVEGVVVVSNPAEPIYTGDLAWRLEENLSVGVLEGDPDYQFSSISDIEVDDEGNIYVLDGRAYRVAVYDDAGTFVMAFGREGEGPGEFKDPERLLWRGDTLVVWDWRLRRFSYFDRHGTLLGDQRLEAPVWISRFFLRPDGMLWAQRGPSYSAPMRPDVDGVGWLLLFDLEAGTADTLFRWQDSARFTVRTESFLTVLPKWYSPQLRWTAAGDGTLYAARGATYEIELYAADGERVGTIRREYTRYPPTVAERDSGLAWIEEVAEDYDPTIAGRVRRAFEISDQKPATGELRISDDGYLWVRTYTEDDFASTTWDVFDRQGRYVSGVITPVRLTIRRITSEALYGALRDELDVPYVKRYVRAGVPSVRESREPSGGL